MSLVRRSARKVRLLDDLSVWPRGTGLPGTVLKNREPSSARLSTAVTDGAAVDRAAMRGSAAANGSKVTIAGDYLGTSFSLRRTPEGLSIRLVQGAGGGMGIIRFLKEVIKKDPLTEGLRIIRSATLARNREGSSISYFGLDY